jgi:hypothetical protein
MSSGWSSAAPAEGRAGARRTYPFGGGAQLGRGVLAGPVLQEGGGVDGLGLGLRRL